MSASALKPASQDTTRIGECAAAQPLSGISRVDASSAVCGMGHNGFVRMEKTERTETTR